MTILSNLGEKLKHYSTQALLLATGIPALWASVPEEIKVLIPAENMATVTAIVAAAGFIGKFIPQRSVKPTIELPKDERELAKAVQEIIKERGADALRTAIRKGLE